jgi:CHAD domain-containing protein
MAKQLETDGASDDAGKPQLAKSVVWAIDARAARRAEDVREAIHAAGTVYVPGPLHQVRIALKKLRFALELKAEAHHKPATREIATLKRSQDLLGRLHDLQVLIEHARKLPVSRPGPDPAAGRDLASLVRLLERDCRKLHARYLRNASTLVSIAEAVGSSRALAARLARREWRGERQLA